MKIKSLLLSAAAGLAAVAGTSFVNVTSAQAQNVLAGTTAICGVTSNNYYILPGTSICFQLGGRIVMGLSYTSHTQSGGQPILSGAFVDTRVFSWSAQLSFRTRSVSNIGNTRSRFVLGFTPDNTATLSTLNVALLNGRTAANGLFPFLMVGTAMVTTKGRNSIATFPGAGFAGGSFRFVRGTTIVAETGNATDPFTGIGRGNDQPMAVIGSTPYSTVFNTGDGNVNIPRLLIHDSGLYVAFAIERKCTGANCNQPSSLSYQFITSTTGVPAGTMTRPDMIIALGQQPDWGNWQIVWMLVPDNNLGGAPWSLEEIAHAVMLGLVVDSIDNVMFRLNYGYMHRTLGTLSAPGNTRIAGNPVNMTGIASTDTGHFISGGIDWDITDDIAWTLTASYLRRDVDGFDKAHISHLLAFDDIGGVMGLGLDLRNTWIDNGANTTRRFLTEFDVDYEDAFGVMGLDLSFDTNWLLDFDWSHISFNFLPRVVYDSGSMTNPRVRFQIDATFDDSSGTFGFEELIIGGIPNNQGNRMATPVVEFDWDPVTLGFFADLRFDDAFNFVDSRTGVRFEVEPLFGNIDFSIRWDQLWNPTDPDECTDTPPAVADDWCSTLTISLGGRFTDYLGFDISTEIDFDQDFNVIDASLVLALLKGDGIGVPGTGPGSVAPFGRGAEFMSNHRFSAELEFNFGLNMANQLVLDYIELQTDFDLTPGTASGYANINAFFDVRLPFVNWVLDEVRYRYGLTLTHTF